MTIFCWHFALNHIIFYSRIRGTCDPFGFSKIILPKFFKEKCLIFISSFSSSSAKRFRTTKNFWVGFGSFLVRDSGPDTDRGKTIIDHNLWQTDVYCEVCGSGGRWIPVPGQVCHVKFIKFVRSCDFNLFYKMAKHFEIFLRGSFYRIFIPKISEKTRSGQKIINFCHLSYEQP